jgi:hypothetical protein
MPLYLVRLVRRGGSDWIRLDWFAPPFSHMYGSLAYSTDCVGYVCGSVSLLRNWHRQYLYRTGRLHQPTLVPVMRILLCSLDLLSSLDGTLPSPETECTLERLPLSHFRQTARTLHRNAGYQWYRSFRDTSVHSVWTESLKNSIRTLLSPKEMNKGYYSSLYFIQWRPCNETHPPAFVSHTFKHPRTRTFSTRSGWTPTWDPMCVTKRSSHVPDLARTSRWGVNETSTYRQSHNGTCTSTSTCSTLGYKHDW